MLILHQSTFSVIGNSLGAVSDVKADGVTTCILSSDYAISKPKSKDLTTYISNMLLASSAKSGEIFLASPAFIGYAPSKKLCQSS